MELAYNAKIYINKFCNQSLYFMKTYTNPQDDKMIYTFREHMSKYNELYSLVRYNLLYFSIFSVYNVFYQIFSDIILLMGGN